MTKTKKKKVLTKEEFVHFCWKKAYSQAFIQMRKLALPMAMNIMNEEIDRFTIKN